MLYFKCICHECGSKKVAGEKGVQPGFENLGLSGALKTICKDGDKLLKEDITKLEKHCFIDGRGFNATEAGLLG
jgi:hypothetical protein